MKKNFFIFIGTALAALNISILVTVLFSRSLSDFFGMTIIFHISIFPIFFVDEEDFERHTRLYRQIFFSGVITSSIPLIVKLIQFWTRNEYTHGFWSFYDLDSTFLFIQIILFLGSLSCFVLLLGYCILKK